MTHYNDIDREARRLRDEGYGWEDILVRLKHLGVTKSHAREVVFRKQLAARLGHAKRREAEAF